MPRSDRENYYDILKVDTAATTSEIVAAYHKAKSAFAKGSVATYSLFSDADIDSVMSKIEEAYQVLTNSDKRRNYDRILAGDFAEEAPLLSPLERQEKARDSSTPNLSEEAEQARAKIDSTPIEFETLTGAALQKIRELRKLSMEDVCRITKIPSKSVKAIEADDFENLPARVYVQGFVKNLAQIYQLDPQKAMTTYLEHFNRNIKEKQ